QRDVPAPMSSPNPAARAARVRPDPTNATPATRRGTDRGRVAPSASRIPGDGPRGKPPATARSTAARPTPLCFQPARASLNSRLDRPGGPADQLFPAGDLHHLRIPPRLGLDHALPKPAQAIIPAALIIQMGIGAFVRLLDQAGFHQPFDRAIQSAR